MDAPITLFIYITGTFFVVLFADRFFNNNSYEPDDADVKNALALDPRLDPALPKHLTEKTRYNVYLSIFIVYTLILYYFVSLLFPVLVLKQFNIDFATNYSIAFVAGTLAFITLSTKIPHIKQILTEWKDDLHKRAQIPDRGMNVFRYLRKSTIKKSTPHFDNNLKTILHKDQDNKQRRDIDESFFDEPKNSLEGKWSRVVYLMYTIDNWSTNKQFKRHLETESLKWIKLEQRYRNTLIPIMERYSEGTLHEEELENTKKAIDMFFIKISWLSTLLLFMANKAGEDPCIHLKRAGWIVENNAYFEFSSKHIILAGLAIFISILAGAAISSVTLLKIANTTTTLFSITPKMVSHWLIYGVTMFVTPLAVTMFLKRCLSMNGVWETMHAESPKKPFSERQWDIYFFASATSYVTTFAVLAGVYSLLTLAGERASPDAISKIASYSFLAVVTSGYLCHLLDTPISGLIRSRKYFLYIPFCALTQGLLNVAIIIFMFLMHSINSFDLSILTPDKVGKLIIYSTIGFTIGITINLTTRFVFNPRERRNSESARSADGWLTISINSIKKRAKIMSQSINHFEIDANDELKDLADVGDPIGIYDENTLVRTGKVEAINDESIRILIPA
jgi:hypothetical protein